MNDVSLNDYQNGFLGGQQEGTLELLKAMQAGQVTGRDTTDQSLTQEPLKVESLETTLKLLDFRLKDIRLLNSLPKLTAYNTVEEFLQLDSYGADRGGFYNEGELSDVEDSTYIRRSELIKYIQVTGEVTMQAQMVRSYVDAMRQETENKVMWVKRRANAALTKGNASIIPQEFNSIYKQHASIGSGDGFLYGDIDEYYTSPVVVDLRGDSLKQEDVENAAVTVDDNYGNVSDLFAPPSVISALSQDYFERQRIMLNAAQAGSFNGTIGTVAKAISTTMGDIALQPDKFMKQDFTNGRLSTDGATSSKAPSVPVADGASPVASAGADSSSAYVSGDAGNVFYAVSALNRYGESALTVLDDDAVAITAGQSINLKFTAAASGQTTNGFRIYRTEVTAAGSPTGLKFYPLFSVSKSELTAGYDGGAAGIVRDRGRHLPNTEQAFVTEMATDVLSLKQLAPISKLDLAVLSMSRRFICFNFITPQIYAPKKVLRFVNVGKTLTS